MSSPLVSVCMPTCNRGAFLRQSLPTILSQRYERIEIFISDNASTDETEAICREASASDPRIRYLRHPHNIGIHRNHNFCIEESSGEFLGFCHDDDLYLPTFVSDNARFLMANPSVGVVCSDWGLIDEVGAQVGNRAFGGPPITIGFDYIEQTIAAGRSSICLPGALFRREALGGARLPESGPLGFADFALCFEVAEHWAIGHINQQLWSYRQHSQSLSRRTIESLITDLGVNLDLYFRGHLARWPAHAALVARWRALSVRYAFYAIVYELCLHASPQSGDCSPDQFRTVFEIANYQLTPTEVARARAIARQLAQTPMQRIILFVVERLLAAGFTSPLAWASRHTELARVLVRAK